MKLAEFNALCEREWGEARGDVIGLSLTDESAEELHRDVIIRFAHQGYSHHVSSVMWSPS